MTEAGQGGVTPKDRGKAAFEEAAKLSASMTEATSFHSKFGTNRQERVEKLKDAIVFARIEDPTHRLDAAGVYGKTDLGGDVPYFGVDHPNLWNDIETLNQSTVVNFVPLRDYASQNLNRVRLGVSNENNGSVGYKKRKDLLGREQIKSGWGEEVVAVSYMLNAGNENEKGEPIRLRGVLVMKKEAADNFQAEIIENPDILFNAIEAVKGKVMFYGGLEFKSNKNITILPNDVYGGDRTERIVTKPFAPDHKPFEDERTEEAPLPAKVVPLPSVEAKGEGENNDGRVPEPALAPAGSPSPDSASGTPIGPEATPPPEPHEKTRTKADYAEVLKRMKEGSDEEKALVILYDAFLEDLHNEKSKHQLSKAYQAAKKSLENIGLGGEAAKLVQYMKLLYITAGLGEYDAIIKFEQNDDVKTQREKIIAKLKADFEGLDKKIAEKAMEPAIKERVKFLQSELKTREVLMDTDSSRSDVRRAVYSHAREKTKYHNMFISYARQLEESQSELESKIIQAFNKDEAQVVVGPSSSYESLEVPLRDALVEREFNEFKGGTNSASSLAILEEIKSSPTELEGKFKELTKLRLEIEYKRNQLAASFNDSPDSSCDLIFEIKELELSYKTEKARLGLEIAEKRVQLADEKMTQTRNKLIQHKMSLKEEWKAGIEKYASRLNVVKRKFDAGMVTIPASSLYQPLPFDQRVRGIGVVDAKEVALPTRQELLDFVDIGKDAFSYYSQSVKDRLFKFKEYFTRYKMKTLGARGVLKERVQIARVRDRQNMFDTMYQTKLNTIRLFKAVWWRINANRMARAGGAESRRILNEKLDKLKDEDIRKRLKRIDDGWNHRKHKKTESYIEQFDRQLFAAFDIEESFDREGMEKEDYEVVVQRKKDHLFDEWFVVYRVGNEVVVEEINRKGKKIRQVGERKKYDSEEEAKDGISEVIEEAREVADARGYDKFESGLRFEVGKKGKLVVQKKAKEPVGNEAKDESEDARSAAPLTKIH